MFSAYIIVTILTAAANTYAAIVDFRRPQWVLDNTPSLAGDISPAGYGFASITTYWCRERRVDRLLRKTMLKGDRRRRNMPMP